jgi:hypothetical protein
MMKVRKPLIVMGALFSASVAGAVVFAKAIEETWHHNPVANSAILGLLGIGLAYTLYTLIMLWRGQRQWREFENNLITWNDSTQLKGVLSFFNGRLESELGSHDAQLREEIIASFESSLDLRSRLAEYMAGLLIGLGLLGTFIGLMATMGSIGSVLDALNAPGGIKVADMLSGLSQPLAGMSSAFSASLMGLLGSLLMGAIAQFMSDANDNLVQRIRSWSQIRNVKEEAGTLRPHTGNDGSEAHRQILAARAAHSELMSELVTWRERSAIRDQALLAAVEQLFVLGGQHYKAQAEVPLLLKSMNEQLTALTATTHSLADGMSRTQDSMSRIAVGSTRMVGSIDESRVVVSSAIRSLADTLSGLSQDGASVVRQMMSMEQVLIADTAHSQRMTQSMQIQQDAMLELVGHISSLSTAVAMGDEVLLQEVVGLEEAKHVSQ